MNRREIATKVAWSFHGLPYLWGGDDPIDGFDCSGMVIEILKSVGILPREGDWTAQRLWTMFERFRVQVPIEGCLVFWQSESGRVIHVEYCLDTNVSIGASGGGSKTKSRQDAVAQNAYIKVRPFRSRPRLQGFLDPFLAPGG